MQIELKKSTREFRFEVRRICVSVLVLYGFTERLIRQAICRRAVNLEPTHHYA